MFVRNIWPKYNLGQPVIGRKEVVESLKRDDIKKYVSVNYVPENIIVSVAGKFKIDEMVKKLKKVFGARNGTKKMYHKHKMPDCKTGINIVEKETEQVHFCFGSKGVSYHDDNRYFFLCSI